jgi:Holliday junction resolvase RusA-like endonuclease
MKQLLFIKPLSVNEAWQGKRYKTDKYKQFEKTVLLMLLQKAIPDTQLKVTLTFGFSSKLSDIDNPIKMTLDILQKKYKINDNKIYQLVVNKLIVEKGHEFIDIEINY